MSGGSYEYVYIKIQEAASTLRSGHPHETHITALADHLDRIASVMHDIEWADSCDTSWTPELDEAIRALLHPGAERAIAVDVTLRSIDTLRAALTRETP